MTRYAQFCPVAKAAEVVAERWTPLIIRELLSGNHRYGEIQAGVPRMSPSLLARRLRQLRRAGLIERRTDDQGPRYHLTPAGEELRPVVEGLGTWGRRWMHEIADDELDPTLLMINVYRRIDRGQLPDQQTVVHIRLTDADPAERDWWLLLGPGHETDVCRTDRGFDVDLRLDTEVRTLTEVWTGNLGLNEALRSQAILLAGRVRLQRRLHAWLRLSQFAHIDPAPEHLRPARVG